MTIVFEPLNLEQLPENVELPRFDRSALKPRIVHIGFGAFARAHVAMHLHEALEKAGGDWGMRAVELFGSPDLFNMLDKNDRLYTLLETCDEETRVRVLGALCDTQHVAREGIQALINGLAEEQVSIISLTVTEKGYCVKNGTLDLDNPAIQHDLNHLNEPKTAIGLIVAGLANRRALENGPVTVLSCDNLPSNGKLCGIAVREFAARVDLELATWIDDNVSFPSTMVDRIVPALTDEARAQVKDALGGQEDPNGIVCEPFRQWVIEDNFKAGRPDYSLAGAQLVDDVEPFEEMKLRTLNGSHSFYAYLGFLAGKETIAECAADPVFYAEGRKLMVDEQAPTLDVPGDVDLIAYADMLLKRYSNTKLKHRTYQIASDGSQKLPQRWLNSVRYHLEHGSDHRHLILGVAGWMHYVRGKRGAESYKLADPMAEKLQDIAARHTGDDQGHVNELLAIEEIFGKDLSSDKRFTSAVHAAFAEITEKGTAGAVAALAN